MSFDSDRRHGRAAAIAGRYCPSGSATDRNPPGPRRYRQSRRAAAPRPAGCPAGAGRVPTARRPARAEGPAAPGLAVCKSPRSALGGCPSSRLSALMSSPPAAAGAGSARSVVRSCAEAWATSRSVVTPPAARCCVNLRFFAWQSNVVAGDLQLRSARHEAGYSRARPRPGWTAGLTACASSAASDEAVAISTERLHARPTDRPPTMRRSRPARCRTAPDPGLTATRRCRPPRWPHSPPAAPGCNAKRRRCCWPVRACRSVAVQRGKLRSLATPSWARDSASRSRGAWTSRFSAATRLSSPVSFGSLNSVHQSTSTGSATGMLVRGFDRLLRAGEPGRRAMPIPAA